MSFVSLDQGTDGVRVRLARADGTEETAEAAYVVGCDGAHSAVRRALGIAFEGDAFPYPFMLGDVRLDWPAGSALERGHALRAIVLHDDAPPDLFVAVPLPEHDRYRVSMMAEADAEDEAADGVAHGLQTDRLGVPLAALQAVAGRIMASPPVLSDLRWSSRFRISMRLAARYRDSRVFIAGDATHIHPPTGGQGMNTGIQDAYNLAWKLALVLAGRADAALLDTYEAERRPVARDVIARTTEESVNFGRPRTPPHRLADTQLLVTYRGRAGLADHGEAAPEDAPRAGDRAPDAHGLHRRGVGFPLRLFDLTRGTEHVLLVAAEPDPATLAALEADAAALRAIGLPLRLVAVAPASAFASVEGAPASVAPMPFGVTLVHDAEGAFAAAYRTTPGAAFLVRPDGYLAFTARPYERAALEAALAAIAAR
ncbi:FAD-dependent monooxygenase [Segnochrobactrum spirostomi]|uniref:FAD-dependent monooxygenase n=1 Tax=Segnochrobactrum spirostomi TaxID=2608987 RepID=UPI0035E4631F